MRQHGDVIYLASTSPRRQDLLRAADLAFRCIEPGHEPGGEGTPSELAEYRAVEKVRGARFAGLEPGGLVLGSDTVVEARGREWAKAADVHEARSMLQALAGIDHRVHTAHAAFVVMGGAALPEIHTQLVTATVRFRSWDEDSFESYLASGHWQGKAGAYGLQDEAQSFASLIEGDFDAVVGLSIRAVRSLGEACGVELEGAGSR